MSALPRFQLTRAAMKKSWLQLQRSQVLPSTDRQRAPDVHRRWPNDLRIENRVPRNEIEPPRFLRRLVCLSQAAMAGPSAPKRHISHTRRAHGSLAESRIRHCEKNWCRGRESRKSPAMTSLKNLRTRRRRVRLRRTALSRYRGIFLVMNILDELILAAIADVTPFMEPRTAPEI